MTVTDKHALISVEATPPDRQGRNPFGYLLAMLSGGRRRRSLSNTTVDGAPVHGAQLPGTPGSERPVAAWPLGLRKSPQPRMGTVAPVTVAPVTGGSSGGVLAGGAPDVRRPDLSKQLPRHGGDGCGSG